MTPEQRARGVLDYHNGDPVHRPLIEVIAAAIRAAVAQERKGCLALAVACGDRANKERHEHMSPERAQEYSAGMIAAAEEIEAGIRARAQAQGTGEQA